jgi:hypothetical protein
MKYEYKYIVPISQLDRLRSMIMPFLEPDSFAAKMPHHEYTVRSIYFDTVNFDFYFEKIVGFKIRKKLRVRGYNQENQSNMVFLEIKHKYYEPIEKNRTPIHFSNMLELFAEENLNGHGEYLSEETGGYKSDPMAFFYHIYSKNLIPVILVIYEREAYMDKFGSGVRITFDKNLRSVPYPELRDLYREENVKPCMLNHFIFEVKFKRDFPFWLGPRLAQLGIQKQSASKYIFGIDAHKLVGNMKRVVVISRSAAEETRKTNHHV